MRFQPRYTLAACAVLLGLLAAGQSFAHLIISPMRFVFEDKTRRHTLMMMNTDSKTHTFRLGWKLMKMDEQGQYQDLPPDDSNAFSVPKMVVFSPRQVTLASNGRQNVNLALRRPADLPPGEYRGHLLFDELPEDEELGATGESPSVKVKVVLGFTVPVIVRSGDIAQGEVTIGTPQLTSQDNTSLLKLDIGHTPGVGSVYGQVIVKAADEQVGILNNVAIYPEMSKRTVNVPLTRPISPGASVVVSYVGDGEYKGKTLATKQTTVTQ